MQSESYQNAKGETVMSWHVFKATPHNNIMRTLHKRRKTRQKANRRQFKKRVPQ